MSSYSPIERSVSRLLGRFPRLRAELKFLYQNLNYRLHREAGFTHVLADGCALATPSQLVGLPEPRPGIAEYFGYFDASPWSQDQRYYAVNQVAEHDRDAKIVLYDLRENSRTEIGSTPAWTWQQGAMLRWMTYRGDACLAFNAVKDDVLGTVFYSPQKGRLGFLSYPLQAVNEVYGLIYSINYLRLHANKTEYGYNLQVTNLSVNRAAEVDGIWAIDVDCGKARLIVSLSTLLQIMPRDEMQHSVHEVNHLSVAPSGERLVFVHRYRGRSGQFSRLYVARHDGSELKLILDDDMVSHYTWLSERELLAWARTHRLGDRYYLVDIDTGEATPIHNDLVNRWGDGHPTFHAEMNLFVTDSYADRKRQQHLLQLDGRGFQPVELARFLLPLKFQGNNRIDLHPRWSPDGSRVSVDAGFIGQRRNYVLSFDEEPPSSAS